MSTMARRKTDTAAMREIKRLKAEIASMRKAAKRRKTAKKSASIRFKEADIVVTDPCYLIPDRDTWLGLCRILEKSSDPQKAPAKYGNMILANTIFGDWFCRMMNFDGERTKEIDTFTADSGTVCVAALTKESEKVVKSTMPDCYTIIRGFTGVARIAHVRGECLVTLKGTCKSGKINAWSVQAG